MEANNVVIEASAPGKMKNVIVDADILKKLAKLFKPGKELHNLTFTAEDGHASASMFDGIKYIKAAFDAKVETQGQVIFPSKYLSLFPIFEKEVSFTLQKKISVKDGVRSFEIPLMTGIEPVGMPDLPSMGSITVSLADIKRLIKKVMFATGTEDDYDFDCIKLVFGDQIEAVGCDRRTLAVAHMPQGSPYRGDFLFPKEGLDVISRLEGDIATLTVYPTGMGISVGGELMVDIFLPQHAGKFPTYGELFEFEPKTTMTCQQADLVSVLEDVRRISDEVAISFSIHEFEKQQPRFRSSDAENAAAVRHIDGQWEGEDLKIKVNARTLAHCVENLNGPITFNFSNFMAPFMIRSGEDFSAILAPYTSAENK